MNKVKVKEIVETPKQVADILYQLDLPHSVDMDYLSDFERYSESDIKLSFEDSQDYFVLLEDLVKIAKQQKELGKKIKVVSFLKVDVDNWDGSIDYVSLVVVGLRDETPKELKARLDKEKKNLLSKERAKKAEEEKELKLYLKLKKKFEGEV